MPLFARFRHGSRQGYALLEGDRLRPIEGGLFGEHRALEESVPLAEAVLLAPVRPGKILAAAVNYPSHVQSSRRMLQQEQPPSVPQLFLKPASSIIGPQEPIVLPAGAGRVDYEGELVAVIGRPCRGVSPEEALSYVFGYTCGNDVSARYWQRDDLQWWRAKGSDTFSPIGPVIATGLDPGALELATRLNGQVVQRASTGEMVFSTAQLISFISRAMTLEPGDLVFTGTPGETGRLSPGDVVEVEVQGIGVLRNPVVAQEEAAPG